jgi:hypothetical protein
VPDAPEQLLGHPAVVATQVSLQSPATKHPAVPPTAPSETKKNPKSAKQKLF